MNMLRLLWRAQSWNQGIEDFRKLWYCCNARILFPKFCQVSSSLVMFVFCRVLMLFDVFWQLAQLMADLHKMPGVGGFMTKQVVKQKTKERSSVSGTRSNPFRSLHGRCSDSYRTFPTAPTTLWCSWTGVQEEPGSGIPQTDPLDGGAGGFFSP